MRRPRSTKGLSCQEKKVTFNNSVHVISYISIPIINGQQYKDKEL